MKRALRIILLTIGVLAVLFCTACTKVKAKLANGEVIHCEIWERKDCGVSFYRCDDHDHECETNFEWEEH